MTQIHDEKDPRQRQVNREERRGLQTEMVSNEVTTPAEVEEHLEPAAVLTKLEIVKVEVPMPGGADHGPNRVLVMAEGDNARLEHQFLAGSQRPVASVNGPSTPAHFRSAISATRAARHSGFATRLHQSRLRTHPTRSALFCPAWLRNQFWRRSEPLSSTDNFSQL